MKPTIDPKTVKAALKIAGIVLAVATTLVGLWEAGAITDGASFVVALFDAASGALNDQP